MSVALGTFNGVAIKNCPLCGGYGKLEKKSKTIVDGEVRYMTYVRCIKCDCRGPRVLMNYRCTNTDNARNVAVSKWNRRVGNEAE